MVKKPDKKDSGFKFGGGSQVTVEKKNKKKKKEAKYIGSAIRSEYGGKELSNKSYESYYKDLI